VARVLWDVVVGLGLLLWRLVRLVLAAGWALLAVVVKLGRRVPGLVGATGRALARPVLHVGRRFKRQLQVAVPLLAILAAAAGYAAQLTSSSDAGTRSSLGSGHRIDVAAALTGARPLSLAGSHSQEVSNQLGGTRPTQSTTGGIPRRYLHIYQLVAREYGLQWNVLAAVGQIESDHGRSPLPGVKHGVNGAGAAGPAQFLGSTWARYGVDVHGSGRPNPYDPADAITAMAAYLKANGAPQDWREALYTYNHSWGYVDAVLSASRRLASEIH
jgi:membrane-bound lytic murein transglycosylase B